MGGANGFSHVLGRGLGGFAHVGVGLDAFHLWAGLGSSAHERGRMPDMAKPNYPTTIDIH